MKRKILAILSVLVLVHVASAEYPPVQNRGPIRISTSIAVNFLTVPTAPVAKILYSTGFNVPDEAGTSPRASMSSNTITYGQFIPARIYLEIVNYSTHPLYLGYSANVTTFPTVNMGRLVPQSTTTVSGTQIPGYIRIDGCVRDYYVNSDDNIPLPQILVIQNK